MKNPVQPDTEITLPDPMSSGEPITLLLQFDFEAIARAEDITGRSLLLGLTRRDIDHPSISLVRAMFFAALLRREPKIEYSEAAAFVTQKTIGLVWGKVIAAWVASRREAEESNGDPTIAQS